MLDKLLSVVLWCDFHKLFHENRSPQNSYIESGITRKDVSALECNMKMSENSVRIDECSGKAVTYFLKYGKI